MEKALESVTNIISIIKSLVGYRTVEIYPDTDILIELDIDSLSMIELTEKLRHNYGIDFLASPHTIEDLRTPSRIAKILTLHAGFRKPVTE